MGKYDRVFRLMVEHGCYPDMWGGKVFVEASEVEVLVRDYPTLLDAVEAAVLMAVEERMGG